jgi:hypothetical protein
VRHGLAIKDITKTAFQVLGESGIIRSADHHQCEECTHAHKATADILTGDDPAGVVGMHRLLEIVQLIKHKWMMS